MYLCLQMILQIYYVIRINSKNLFFFREIEAEKTLARKDSIISPYFQQHSALIAWLISRKNTILVHTSRLVFSLFVKWKKIRNSFDKTTHFKCGSGLFLGPEDFLQFISLEEWLNITKHKKICTLLLLLN